MKLWIKNLVRRSNLRKICVHNRGFIFHLIFLKLHSNVFMNNIPRTRSNMDYVGSKTRSLGQITEKVCVHNRGFIFNGSS